MSKCWILFLSRSAAFRGAVLWWRAQQPGMRDLRSKYSYTATVGRKQKPTCRDSHLLLSVAPSTIISIINEYTRHPLITSKLSIICPYPLPHFSSIRLFKNGSGSLLSWHKNMMVLSFARCIAMSLVSVFWTETMPSGFLTAIVKLFGCPSLLHWAATHMMVAVAWAWTEQSTPVTWVDLHLTEEESLCSCKMLRRRT